MLDELILLSLYIASVSAKNPSRYTYNNVYDGTVSLYVLVKNIQKVTNYFGQTANNTMLKLASCFSFYQAFYFGTYIVNFFFS